MSPLAHPRHSAIPSWVSRQLGFETWEDFFVREDQRHNQFKRCEDEEATQRRMARERKAATISNSALIASFGMKVYAWLKLPSGLRVRTLLNGGDLHWRWGMYTSRQRKYNSYDSEWDVCSEFGDECQTGRPRSYEDPTHWEDEAITYEPLSDNEEPSDTEKDYELALGTLDFPLETYRSYIRDQKLDVLDICDTRYGLRKYPLSDTPLSLDHTKLPIGSILYILTERDNCVPPEWEEYIQAFVMHIMENCDVPPAISSLNVDSVKEVLLNNGWDPLRFIQAVQMVSGTLYLLIGVENGEQSTRGVIATTDSIQAFRWSRFPRATQRQVLKWLISEGARVMFLKEISEIPPVVTLNSYPDLAWRKLEYIPNRSDYIAYCYQRNNSSPRRVVHLPC
ncbi:hypothetical protein M422DRAFT_270463 [Sphaerobolus stellatus SS14]|uniref:Unplaced genomic scaffold SPHSTscaffold_236, whole genome shotgun sequence n=1 Tax=Sphaerobolus stellatus (strain SS14) TaxID=990650 RepID=A0A0C9TFR7_SPHS4|nr:hypothetical protein M422DRAFT_270463 [Sphaerobolus stellatus SS14]